MNKPLAVEAAALRAAGVAVRGDTPVAAPDDAGSQAEAAVATAAPPMAAGDVPIGMQSLEVPFSVADTIDARDAERLPVRDAWAARVELVPLAPPPAVAEPPWSRLDREASDIAFLGSLLVRVRERRRSRTP